MFAPPFSRALSCHSKQIRSQRAPLRSEAVGSSPHLGKGLLHHIFRRLPTADDLTQKPQQMRPYLSVKRIESLRLSAANLLPQFAVLSQFHLHLVIRSCSPKSSSHIVIAGQLSRSLLRGLLRLWPSA